MSTELKRVLDKAIHDKHEYVSSLKKAGTPLVEVLAYESGADRVITTIRTAYRKLTEPDHKDKPVKEDS